MKTLVLVSLIALSGCTAADNPLNNPYVQAIGRGMQGYGNHMQQATYVPRSCTTQNVSGIVGQQSKTWVTSC